MYCGIQTYEYQVQKMVGTGRLTQYKSADLFCLKGELTSYEGIELHIKIPVSKIFGLYVLQGNTETQNGAQLVMVNTHEFLYQEPLKEQLVLHLSSQTKVAFVLFWFSATVFKRYELDKGIKHNKVFSFSTKTSPILQKIVEDKQEGLLKRLLLDATVLLLLEDFMQIQTRKSTHKAIEKYEHFIEEVKQMITSHLDKIYTTQELAREVGVSESILRKKFKEKEGATINVYSVKYKMDFSRQLLSDTDQPIYEIAEQVGYKNPTHFTAAFKRFFGTTPQEHRKGVYTIN